MTETVQLEIDGAIATMTLNRPEALNALNAQMADDFTTAFERLDAATGVRVLVLRGAGTAFMAGGDIKGFEPMMQLTPAERRAHFERFIHRVHPTILAMRRLKQPIIAQVHGAAAGIGMSLILAADLAIAADDTRFTLAYCHLGTSPDGGSTFFLPRHVGSKKAMEIALLGDRFDAATALRLGLVNDIVPATELAQRVGALAARLARGPAAAYAATKRLFNGSAGATIETQLQAELESFAACAATPDFAEGVAAFIAKRPATFGKTD